MSEMIEPDLAARIVGVERHQTLHYGRAVSSERRVYILHSDECREHYDDLTRCPYSRALDLGIEEAQWEMDRPVVLGIWDGRLITEG